MGYIERADGIPNFSSAVISIWFKIPEAAITAKTAEWVAWSEGDGFDGDLIGVIPLLTFGPNEETAYFEGDMETGDLSPCVVGVLCDDVGAHLYFRAQYSTGAQGYPIDFNDYFQVGGRVGAGVSVGDYPEPITVTPDAWHHVIISFDFSGGCATSGGDTPPITFDTICPFHWAFDDTNYTGDYLGPNTPSCFGHAAAAGIVSELCTFLGDTASPPGGDPYPPSLTFAAGDIPTNGNPIGIPASADRVAHIQNIQKGPVQVFTGVTMDTSVEANRRVFVKSNGRPERPSSAADHFGKSPEILFETHSDFIDGNNRGTEGNFEPTGTITPYTPGP